MRIGAYIDGFNLYYGMKRMGWRHLYWLNVESLCEALKPSGSTLEFVNFYTSRSKDATRNQDKAGRQQLYWRALRTLSKTNLIEGKILPRQSQCEAQCRQGFTRYQEKETDVKIGVDIVRDILKNAITGLILITADTDQVPTLEFAKTENQGLLRRLALPPSDKKFPLELTQLAHKPIFSLSDQLLATHQFPARLLDSRGKPIDRPLKWTRNRL